MVKHDNNSTVALTGEESIEEVAELLGIDATQYQIGEGRVDDAQYQKITVLVPSSFVAMASIAQGFSALINRAVRKAKAAVDSIKTIVLPSVKVGQIALIETHHGKTAGSLCHKYGKVVFEPAHNGRWVVVSKPSARYDGKVSVNTSDARFDRVKAAIEDITKAIN